MQHWADGRAAMSVSVPVRRRGDPSRSCVSPVPRSLGPASSLVEGLLVVLAQEVATVIAAVGRADDGVDVLARWHVILQRDAPEVVELDQDDRRVDAVVEDVVLTEA